jgi:hypothetical protein
MKIRRSNHPVTLNLPVLSQFPNNIDEINILDYRFVGGEWDLMFRTLFDGDPYLFGIDINELSCKKVGKLNINEGLFHVNVIDLPIP